MTDTQDAVRTAAISTALSALAGIVAGPAAAAVVGFITGVPAWLIVITTSAVMIWLDPMAGIWLLIAAITAAGAFILGTMRKPPPGVYRLSQPQADIKRIAQLQRQLAAAQARARQAEILIGCLITAPFWSEPPHPEPREISSPPSTQGGRDGRP